MSPGEVESYKWRIRVATLCPKIVLIATNQNDGEKIMFLFDMMTKEVYSCIVSLYIRKSMKTKRPLSEKNVLKTIS